MQKREITLADYDHIVLVLFDAEIGDSINIMIRNTCVKGDMHDLLRKSMLRLEQMSGRKENEALILKNYEVGVLRTLSLYASHHLNDCVTSFSHGTSIALDVLNNVRISSKHRQLG